MSEKDAETSRTDGRMLDAGALRALAHPLRVKIYDILSQYGPQTASTLAARLGESSGSTSYHLRALASHDLIREVEGRGTARERWWERPEGGVSFWNPEVARTPSGRAATQLVMGEFFRHRQEQLLEYIASGLNADGDPWHDAGLISTASVFLTPEQAHEISKELLAVVDSAVRRFRTQEGEGVRPVTLRTDLFPLPGLDDHS